jgi:hypothetical protein
VVRVVTSPSIPSIPTVTETVSGIIAKRTVEGIISPKTSKASVAIIRVDVRIIIRSDIATIPKTKRVIKVITAPKWRSSKCKTGQSPQIVRTVVNDYYLRLRGFFSPWNLRRFNSGIFVGVGLFRGIAIGICKKNSFSATVPWAASLK